jgi:hypothetical protein
MGVAGALQLAVATTGDGEGAGVDAAPPLGLGPVLGAPPAAGPACI